MHFRCEAIGPDLLFLGCLRSDSAAVESLLAPTNLDFAELRTTIGFRSEALSTRKVPKEMTLTRQGKAVIDYAFEVSKGPGGDHRISVIHIVLGIAEERSSSLYQALKSRGIASSDLQVVLGDAATPKPDSSPEAASGLTAKLAQMQPLDALAIMTIREIRLTVSMTEANRLQALSDEIDRIYEIVPSRSGADPIAETMADAVYLASSRREPLGAAHLLAAMYRRVGSIVNIAAPPHYANPDEMMDRLVRKDG